LTLAIGTNKTNLSVHIKLYLYLYFWAFIVVILLIVCLSRIFSLDWSLKWPTHRAPTFWLSIRLSACLCVYLHPQACWQCWHWHL